MSIALAAGASILFAGEACPAARAEALVNGDFEQFDAAGQPTGWVYVQGDSPNSNIQSTTAATLSPFVSNYPGGNSSLKMEDGTTGLFGQPSLTQTFTAPTHMKFDFDFLCTETPDSVSPWRIRMLSAGNSTAFLLQLDPIISGHGYLNLSDSFNSTPAIVEIFADRYYHVTCDIDQTTRIWSGSVVSTGGDSGSWDGRLINPVAISKVIIDDTSAGLQGRTYYFDNFSVQAVPEPATGIILGGAVMGLSRRRRNSFEFLLFL